MSMHSGKNVRSSESIVHPRDLCGKSLYVDKSNKGSSNGLIGPSHVLKPTHPNPVRALMMSWIAQQLDDRSGRMTAVANVVVSVLHDDWEKNIFSKLDDDILLLRHCCITNHMTELMINLYQNVGDHIK